MKYFRLLMLNKKIWEKDWRFSALDKFVPDIWTYILTPWSPVEAKKHYDIKCTLIFVMIWLRFISSKYEIRNMFAIVFRIICCGCTVATKCCISNMEFFIFSCKSSIEAEANFVILAPFFCHCFGPLIGFETEDLPNSCLTDHLVVIMISRAVKERCS